MVRNHQTKRHLKPTSACAADREAPRIFRGVGLDGHFHGSAVGLGSLSGFPGWQGSHNAGEAVLQVKKIHPLTGPKSKQRARLRWWVRCPAKEGQISFLGESVTRVTSTRSNADGGDGHVSWAGLWPGLDAEFQGSALRASDPSCELPRKALPNPPGLRIHNEAAICG